MVLYAVFMIAFDNIVFIIICLESPINWEAFVIRSLNLSGKLLSHLFCHLTNPPSYYVSLKTYENTHFVYQCQHHDQSRIERSCILEECGTMGARLAWPVHQFHLVVHGTVSRSEVFSICSSPVAFTIVFMV